MARVHIYSVNQGETRVDVTLSRRNLLALLHKLDMPGTRREIQNNDGWRDGEPVDDILLILRCEDDDEHYARRARQFPDTITGPGVMHPDTERYVQEHGGTPGEVLIIE